MLICTHKNLKFYEINYDFKSSDWASYSNSIDSEFKYVSLFHDVEWFLFKMFFLFVVCSSSISSLVIHKINQLTLVPMFCIYPSIAWNRISSSSNIDLSTHRLFDICIYYVNKFYWAIDRKKRTKIIQKKFNISHQNICNLMKILIFQGEVVVRNSLNFISLKNLKYCS